MKQPDFTVSEISGLLADRIDQLAPELLPGGRREGTEWSASDITGAAPRTGGSLRVQLTGQYQGGWRDHATGERGDPIDLIQATQGLGKGKAVRWALHWLGLDYNAHVARSRPKPIPVEPTAAERRRTAKGIAIWQESGSITKTLAEAYLRGRGITISLPPSLRFHPGLDYWDTGTRKPNLVGKFPALVFGIAVFPSDLITAVQVVYLNSETANKAKVKCAKKTFGPTAGGAVRLSSHGPRLAICEGVETGLSILQACPELPVWTTTGTAGLCNVKLPPEVTEVIIAADADPPGEAAAQKSSQKLIAGGCRVKIAKPPHGYNDFNDALVAQQMTQPGKAINYD